MRYLIKIMLIAQMLILPALLAAEVWEGYVSLTKDYIVGNGETLVIMPGTVVRFASGFGLIVDGGTLLAEGTEQDMIKFTSYEYESTGLDDWGGIDFYSANRDTSRISWCIVENIIRRDQFGSIFIGNSTVNITDSYIHDNISENGGAIHIDNSIVNIGRNTIENNTAMMYGGGIYILHTKGDLYPQTYIYKNIIKDNAVTKVKDIVHGGGGIYLYENDPVPSYTLIQENDIIANKTLTENVPSGSGGGIFATTRTAHTADIIGNKIMFNMSGAGGGLRVVHDIINYDAIPLTSFTNNMISNNTSSDKAGGIVYEMGNTKNPLAVKFLNNNIVNNKNTNGKTGAGGFYLILNNEMSNFINLNNCIFWNNFNGTNLSDVMSYPSIYPGNFVTYSNSTMYIEGKGNISANSLFQRTVGHVGAFPYENYLRGDYHLSLESPCLDKGDPETGKEWDGTLPNIGAYGLTLEATPSQYETLPVIQPIGEILIKRGQTIKLDCRNYKENVSIDKLTIEDGGQIYVASKPSDPNIYIKNLVTQGVKIGERYTTKIQRMTTAEGSELTFNILNVENINCTGAQFSNMSVKVNSGLTATLQNSHVYLYDYNLSLQGISIVAPDADITNNIVQNFGIGIYIGSPLKTDKASKGRIVNNTVSFEPTPSSKLNEVAKGIVSENAQADIEGNTVVNPNEGVEAKASSGRITNNTVSFEPTPSSKAGTLKKGIYISGGSTYEVDHNEIYCDDANTTSISAIDIINSAVNCHYNIISFGTYDPAKIYRYGFYADGLLEYPGIKNPTFINNTVNSSNFGLYGINTTLNIRLANNIFYGPVVSTYITSDRKNLLLYNNDIVGTVNSSSIAEAKNNIEYDPYFQSSTVNDFYLWGESKCINSGLYDPDYHIYGETFYGTAPDMGAVEFWQRSSFYAPQNMSCSVSGTTLTLTWSEVPDAVSYNIYSSTDPYGTFSFVKSVTVTSWSASITSAAKYFYRVTASRDGVKYGERETEYPEPEQKKLEIKSNRNLK